MKSTVIIRLFAAVGLAVGLQSIAFAHTALKKATPAADAVVKAAPASISLVFTEPVKLVKLQLMGVGHEMPTSFEPNATEAASFSFDTPGMHPGKFTVNWAVVGEDGHPVSNSYSFTVDPAASGP